MAKKASKRRMTREELRKPDEVMGGLQRGFDWLTRYRFAILGAAGLVVVVVAGYSIWQAVSSKNAHAVSSDFDKALTAATAPVIPEGEDVPESLTTLGIPTFKTSEAKFQAAVKEIEAFLQEHGGSDLASLAKALEGAAKFDLDQFQAAVDDVSAYLSENPETPVALVLHEELGLAYAALGKDSEATEHFAKLGEATDWWFKVQGHMHTGDLYSPLMRKQGAAKDKAVAAYKEALAAIPTEPAELPEAPRFLKEELEKRISLLQ